MAVQEKPDKFKRLLALVAFLEFNDHPVTQARIVEHLSEYYVGKPDAVRQLFERDKKDLKARGVPLLTERVPGEDPPVDGYSIRYDRRMTTLDDLSRAELAALQSAVAGLALRHSDASEVLDPAGGLRKLGGIGGGDKAGYGRAEVIADANLTTAFAAIGNRRGLVFTYGGQVRRVAPRWLQLVKGRWYLTALDQDRRADRTFRLDRVEGTMLELDRIAEEDGATDDVAAEERAGRPGSGAGGGQASVDEVDEVDDEPPPTRFRPWEFGDGAPVPARVRLDAEVARPALADDPGLRVVGEHGDGSIEVELDVRNAEGLWGWLFGFHARAELLGPPDLRSELLSRLDALAGGH